MKTQPLYYEILVLLILTVIPWPGPSVFKISCPRDRASIVRKIVQKRWIPILKKYHVELPLECPFHASRDIFYPQESAKHQHRSSQWTCGLCGKSFYTEKHLDLHFDNRHRSFVNTAEDAVCFADYCDIMRCDVLGYRDFDSYEVDGSVSTNTDLQVWKDTNQYKSSVTPCESRDLVRLKCKKSQQTPTRTTFGGSLHKYCQRSSSSSSAASSGSTFASSSTKFRHRMEIDGPDNKSRACDKSEDDEEDDTEETKEEDEESAHNYESSLPSAANKNRCRRKEELKWLKSNCKPEELHKLKVQCEILVRDCIAGLLSNLSLREFQDAESELNRAICWHLSCERYWEDSRRGHRYIPWYLLITFLTLLSASLYGCYYVVWIVFNADDGRLESEARNVDFNHGIDRHSKHVHNPDPRYQDDRRYKRDVDTPVEYEEPDPYIYVAYPPELKQRLLESCYNRTTRL